MPTLLSYRSFFREDEESRNYWGSQAAGCIFVAKDTGRILLAHRTNKKDQEGNDLVREPNTWGTWGGKIDDKEKPQDAVEREVGEETGYEGQLKISLIHIYRDGDFRYYNYLVVVPFEFTPKLNWENDASKWVEFGEWPSPMHFGLQDLIKRGGARIKQVIDLIKKREIKFESMDSPPAIIKQSDIQKYNIIDNQALTNAYIVIATLWGEARGEGERGMHAVLNVIMNRAKNDFSNTKNVVLKPKQFEFWNKIKDPLTFSLQLAKNQRLDKTSDGKMYLKSIELVSKAMKGTLPDITGGAVVYLNPKNANPKWILKLEKTATIGNHDFYKLRKRLKEHKVDCSRERLKKCCVMYENLTNVKLSKLGIEDVDTYGYELKSPNSYLRYAYNPNKNIFYLRNIGTPIPEEQNQGHAKALLETFFQLIHSYGGALDAGPYTTSGMAYIKHVVERLSKQYNVRLVKGE